MKLTNSNITQTDIVKRLGISAPTVNWHMKRLVALDILEEKRVRFKRYNLRDNETTKFILRICGNRHPSIWNKWSNRMVETFPVESIVAAITLLKSKVKRYANISIRSLINQQRNIEYSFGCS